MISLHTAPEILKTGATTTGHFGICVSGNLGQGNHLIIATPSVSKSSFFKMFAVHTKKEKPAFQILLVGIALSKGSSLYDV